MGIAGRIKGVYARGGIWGILVKAFLKAGRCIVETNDSYWFQRDLSLPIQDVSTKIPVEVNFNETGLMFDWFAGQKGTWMYDEKELQVARRCGHVFPHIRYNGEIIAYAKLAVKEVYIQDYRKVLKLPEGFVFCYDIYVAPALRRYNIAVFLMTELMKYFKGMGFKKTGCQVPPWNIASIGTMTRGGFKKYKYVRHVRILSVIRLYFTRKLNGNEGVL